MLSDQLLYRERLDVGARGWGLFLLAVLITAVAVSPKLVPITVFAWLLNVARFSGTEIRIDDNQVAVGRKRAALTSFDPSTLARACNTWPWRTWSERWLGANPIWTKDSVQLVGSTNRGTVWLNVGTNHRDELVAALMSGIRQAHERQAHEADVGATSTAEGSAARTGCAAQGWYADPWNPVASVRWWDGTAWTSHVQARPGSVRGWHAP
jgi:hypothetical protein